MRIIRTVLKFFDVRLSADEVIYLTHIQVRAM